jgi:hypothetical protein
VRTFRWTNGFCLIFLFVNMVLAPKYHPNSYPRTSLPNKSLAVPPLTTRQFSTQMQPLQQTTVGSATGPLYVNPDNGRYFTDGMVVNGRYKAVVLSGSHTWCDFTDCGGSATPTVFNYTAFLDFLVANNHNFFRLWRAENARGGETGDNFWFSPLPYARSTTCCAFDGGNKFDLTQFNPAYFDRLRQRVIAARDRGIYVSIMLFDGWSVESKLATHQPWKGHPYKLSNNVNNINGDSNNDNQGGETHTLANAQITALQEAYVRKVVDTVNDLDNVLYEISNESSGTSDPWQYHMITYLKNYEAGKAKQHPVGMTVEYPNGSNSDLFNSPADWISPNGDINNPPLAAGTKVILSDTDHLCGLCGNYQWVWKSFTRGENPIFMDPYDGAGTGRGAPPGYDPNNSNDVALRRNLGYVRSYATRINLAAMTPTSNTSLCSTAYCLRNAVASGGEYLAYLPSGGSITINLTATPGTLTVEWFNPSTGTTVSGGPVNGGANRQLTAPFSGAAVLYIYNLSASLSTDTTGVFRPSNGLLYLKNTNSTGFADAALNYGLPGDYPVVGDWDGNGTVTIGIYRNGYFYLKNANTLGFADIVFPFGQLGDQPIAGDWNGDGVDTIGVYRTSTGQFLLRNSNTEGSAQASFYLGNVGDVGVAGDWTGKGYDTTGVFRPSNGVIFLKNKNETGIADIALNYGLPGDRPVMGDWNDDGIDTIGIYRNGMFYLRNSNTNGFAEIIFGLGNPGDMPIAGNWDALP